MVQSSSPPGPASRSERLGRYRLLEKLHDGALGSLWAARATEGIDEGKPFLVRRIPIDSSWPAETSTKLVDAAHAAMRLEHVEIVPVLDVVQNETELGIVSAAVEGETLRTLLWRAGMKRSPIPPSIALRIVLDIISAASHLHEQRGEHSPPTAGLGPDQIVVSVSGHAKLLDPIICGVACSIEPWTKAPKWASYRARETLRQAEPIDERADVFSAGVLLWEMLRNRPLFGGARFEAVERSIVQGSVTRVDSLRPVGAETINRKLGDVVARALEREPVARHKSLAELAAALRDTADGIAKPDGVVAFVERASAEALVRQRELFEGKVDPDALAPEAVPAAVGGPVAAVVPGVRPLPAEGEPTPAAAPTSEGVPDFNELFGADHGKPHAPSTPPSVGAAAKAEDASPAEGSKPPASAPPGSEAASRPPTRKVAFVATEADQSDAAKPAAEQSAEQVPPGDGVIREPTVATAVAPPLERGGWRALLLVAAAIVVMVVAWIWNPFGESLVPAPAPVPSGAAPTANPEPMLEATAQTATASAAESSAPSATVPAEDAAAPTATASASASAEGKPKKKSGGGRYMPGTL